MLQISYVQTLSSKLFSETLLKTCGGTEFYTDMKMNYSNDFNVLILKVFN
jgi:hypothetical protein